MRSLTSLSFAAMAAALVLSGCSMLSPSSGPAKKAVPRDRMLQTQLFLDARNFGPGVVDGRAGEFTAKALARYNESKGLPADTQPDVSGLQSYATYTVTTKDLGVFGTMASEPAELAKQEKLPYTGLKELLSERFHTTQTYLTELNPGKNLNALTAGDTVIVPNIRKSFRFDAFPSSYPPGPSSGRRVIVDIQQRMLEIREGERLIAAFPITPGSSEHPAPVGEWRIVGAVPWPWYRYDEGVLKRGERTESFYNLPPGPNSPVGIMWAGLNRPGVGIHGTPSPDTIGRAGSHGCIRLSNWDVATFYTLVGKGTPVTIR